MTSRSLALAALSGVLLAVSFPTLNVHFLAWIALLPLLLALRGQNVRGGFLIGGAAGLVYFAGTVHWVTNSVHFYGGIPIVPASLITLLLCVYLALYPALFGAAAVYLKQRRGKLFFIAAPALWTALELLRTYVFSGFPWSLLGYTQYLVLPVVQVADLTGVYGVSFLIVLVNTALAEVWTERKNYPFLIIAAAVMALALGYGFIKLGAPEGPDRIKVSVAQGNIEQDKKWVPAYRAKTFSVYTRLTREALKERPDLVLWPETATPFYFNAASPVDAAMTGDLVAFVKQNKVPLLFGSPTYEVTPDRAIHGRNSAFLLSSDGQLVASYHKMHLVPFGEYVPLKRLLFFVEKLVQAIGDFQAGVAHTVMTVPRQRPDLRVGVVICYEIIFPDLVRRFVENGANVLTTMTNDAWFGNTAAPYQHFSMAVFRAVENRVPVARAANTGISGFIDAKGNILAASDLFTEALLTRTLTPGFEKTFYTSHGDLFSYACAGFTLVLLAWRKHTQR